MFLKTQMQGTLVQLCIQNPLQGCFSRLAVSPKPVPGGGFGCFRASEFSDLAIPTKVVFT